MCMMRSFLDWWQSSNPPSPIKPQRDSFSYFKKCIHMGRAATHDHEKNSTPDEFANCAPRDM